VFGNFIGLRRLFLPEYLVYFVVFATAVEYQVILFRPADPITREYVFATAMLSAAAAYFGYETVAAMWKRRI
jgi:hypothetical protein